MEEVSPEVASFRAKQAVFRQIWMPVVLGIIIGGGATEGHCSSDDFEI